MKRFLLVLAALAVMLGLVSAPAQAAPQQVVRALPSSQTQFCAWNDDSVKQGIGINVGFQQTPWGAPQWQLGLINATGTYCHLGDLKVGDFKYFRVGYGYCLRIIYFTKGPNGEYWYKNTGESYYRGAFPFSDIGMTHYRDMHITAYRC